MYYIKEIDKPNKLLNKLNYIKLKNNEIILQTKNEELKPNQAKKLAFKTKKILEKTNCNKIILSKIIKKQELYCNYLNTYGFEISDGKWLWEILSCECIEYIVQKKELVKQNIIISVLVNEITEVTLENIKKLAKEYKRVNVVTNHIAKLKKVEEDILEQEGIMIVVTNNKKKSLLKSNIILNIDFPTELLYEYQIKEDAILMNIQGNVVVKKKRFNGVCINNYEIKKVNNLEYEDIENKFFQKDIYEAHLYKKQPLIEIRKKIYKDRVKIEYLQGIRERI